MNEIEMQLVACELTTFGLDRYVYIANHWLCPVLAYLAKDTISECIDGRSQEVITGDLMQRERPPLAA